ncbi:hypothetical protein ACQRIT_005257 [Beauveria bassiana]
MTIRCNFARHRLRRAPHGRVLSLVRVRGLVLSGAGMRVEDGRARPVPVPAPWCLTRASCAAPRPVEKPAEDQIVQSLLRCGSSQAVDTIAMTDPHVALVIVPSQGLVGLAFRLPKRAAIACIELSAALKHRANDPPGLAAVASASASAAC